MMMEIGHHTLALGALVAVAGCGSAAGTPDAAPAPLPDAGPFVYRTCDLAAKIGEFKVQLDESFTAVSGAVAAGVVPGAVPALARQEGECRLLRRRNLYCEPACDGQSTCGEDGRCIPYPLGRSAGTVTIAGLAAPVTMTPAPLGKHYHHNTLPHPGFRPGDQILLHAAGGEVGPFTLLGRGVAAIELSSDKRVLDRNKALELRWAPGPPGPARVTFQLEIDQHGLSKASLVCDFEDRGAATVSAELITDLIELGTSGFPKLTMARRTVDATSLPSGCVELLVMTATEGPLEISGHHPCRTSADCPTGKTCADAVQTCR